MSASRLLRRARQAVLHVARAGEMLLDRLSYLRGMLASSDSGSLLGLQYDALSATVDVAEATLIKVRLTSPACHVCVCLTLCCNGRRCCCRPHRRRRCAAC